MSSLSSVEQRFISKVDLASNGCWIWNASLFSNGYGQFYDGKTMVRAHRFSYEHFIGIIPPNLILRHCCPEGENRACVNPLHLKLGTHQDNSDDKVSMNGQAKGETQGLSKLSKEEVELIRHLYTTKALNQIEIADYFAISQRNVSYIIRHKTWRHI